MMKSQQTHSKITYKSLLLLLVLSSLAVACGKKSNPRPPEEIAPAAVIALSAKAEVSAVVLSWQAPLETASGDTLEDLNDFVIERSPVVEDESPDYEELGEVLSAEPSQPGPVPVVYNFRDETVEVGKVYEYRVLPRNLDGLAGAATRALRVTFLGESSIIR